MTYTMTQYENTAKYMGCGECKQQGKDDYHCWNIKKNGDIDCNFKKLHPDLEIIYKTWKEVPNYLYNDFKKQFANFNLCDKDEIVELYKEMIEYDNRCFGSACIKKKLFNYDIRCGSMGIKLKNGEILWEYGNGKDYADYK